MIHEAGQLVAGKFRLLSLLGEGGMGSVWSATHAVTQKPVALKFLKGDPDKPDLRKRFLREARAAVAVNHPNVVGIHDVVEEDGEPVIVMDLLEGETLGERLDREGNLPLHETLRILSAVVAAVGAAHEQGVVHRDLKPDNIFLTKDGVRVLDFGIAKLVAPLGDTQDLSTMTATGALVGTPCYMAPEQAFGEKDIDHRADLWAIGIILYQCLSGVLPTRADNIGQILKIIMKEQIPAIETIVSGLPTELAVMIGRLLAREPDDRPADLRQVGELLSKLSAQPHQAIGAPRRRGDKTPIGSSSSGSRTPAGSGALRPGEASATVADPRSAGAFLSTMNAETAPTSTANALLGVPPRRPAFPLVVGGLVILGVGFGASRLLSNEPKAPPAASTQSAAASGAPPPPVVAPAPTRDPHAAANTMARLSHHPSSRRRRRATHRPRLRPRRPQRRSPRRPPRRTRRRRAAHGRRPQAKRARSPQRRRVRSRTSSLRRSRLRQDSARPWSRTRRSDQSA